MATPFYPSSIASLVNPDGVKSLGEPSQKHSVIEAQQNAEIIAIENELGTSLKGSLSNLSTRLNVSLTTNGNIKRAITQVDDDYTVLSTDYLVLVDATTDNVIINLPQASTVTGQEFTIKKSDGTSNSITINGFNNEVIDGELNFLMSSRYRYVKILSDGSNFQIVGNN